MKPSPILTSRLYLRNSYKKDAETLFYNYCSNDISSRFLTRKPHASINQTSDFLNKWCTSGWVQDSKQFAWVIALNGTDEAIGVFLVTLEKNTVQIHYGIDLNFEKQGLITEAGHAVIQWLKSHAEIKRAWTLCDLHNYGSIKVLEKLGFKKEAILRKWLALPAYEGTRRDCIMYGQTLN